MTIEQFAEKYSLHDSSLEKVDFDAEKKILTLLIKYCWWWKDCSNKSEDINGSIRVIFKDVSLFEYDEDIAEKLFSGIDSEILDGDLDGDGNFIIVAVEDDYYQIKIRAASVDVEELERYTL